MAKDSVTIFWHRRDLRTHDNHGLYAALTKNKNVLPVFIFDKNILDKLEDRDDRRVTFIHNHIQRVKKEYEDAGGTLRLFHDTPEEAFRKLLNEFDVENVYTNGDYEPYATERDEKIQSLLKERGAELHTFKDQVVFEKSEITKNGGGPYTVYTPYSKKWKELFERSMIDEYESQNYFQNLYRPDAEARIISLESMGFEENNTYLADYEVGREQLEKYSDRRDLPAVQGTTRVSHHLRFGTISIREMTRKGLQHSEKWLNELIWREFYMMFLHHNPRVVKESFRKEYDQIEWRNNEEEFQKWCDGKTGYPIVDAGMRELNETGFMHNRVRMITASFLTKHLLVHWSWGEAYFARKLLDFELSSNNGGWQWAAGSGCDAAPYFRVFNPELQMKKFDPDLMYVRKWVPEYESLEYAQSAIVPHKVARERALETYKKTLKK